MRIFLFAKNFANRANEVCEQNKIQKKGFKFHLNY